MCDYATAVKDCLEAFYTSPGLTTTWSVLIPCNQAVWEFEKGIFHFSALESYIFLCNVTIHSCCSEHKANMSVKVKKKKRLWIIWCSVQLKYPLLLEHNWCVFVYRATVNFRRYPGYLYSFLTSYFLLVLHRSNELFGYFFIMLLGLFKKNCMKFERKVNTKILFKLN